MMSEPCLGRTMDKNIPDIRFFKKNTLPPTYLWEYKNVEEHSEFDEVLFLSKIY